MTRLLTQLRGARSYVRYLATRLEHTVEIEQLAGRARIEGEAAQPEPAPPPRRPRPPRSPEATRVDGRHRTPPAQVPACTEPAAPAADERQRPLFADLG